MRSVRTAHPSVLLLSALLGCSGSGGAPTSPGPAPQLGAPAITPAADGADAVLLFTLADPEARPVTLTVEVSRDAGASWRPARIDDLAGAPTFATTTAPVEIALAWHCLDDLGFRELASPRLRITARADGGRAAELLIEVPALPRLKAAVARVRDPMIHYGSFDAPTLELARQHDLVVLHPVNAGIDRTIVESIQQGVDPDDPADDVLVLGYVSVGEDLRTIWVDDQQMLQDSRFVGDGSGPRVDPRGPDADGGRLTGLDPLGLPSPGGSGYASYYLDDNSVDRDPNRLGDGLPDRNANFGGCFVNAGDPTWFTVLDQMTVDGPDHVTGMREALTTDYGRGLGCDGLFLDTIDTCAPNYYTDSSSDNQSEFEWTAAGFTAFMRRLRATYPRSVILQNRGLFFYDPRQPHYEVSPRGAVDYVKFESFRLDSSSAHEFHPYFFPDNKYNVAPKLMAEAQREDGFTVLSLGYAEGPPGSMDHATLLGQSTVGRASLLLDIVETEDLLGFRHYITDASVTLANTFVHDHRSGPDTSPPVWSSTYNANVPPWPDPPGAPTPRVGIQRADAGDGEATVHWDVATDRGRVGYVAYVQASMFDFDGDPSLSAARRFALTPRVGANYASSYGPGTYAFQDTIPGLTNGMQFWICIRAHDEDGNEDDNRTFATATPFQRQPLAVDGLFDDWRGVPVTISDPADAPDSAGPDWLQIQLADSADFLFVHATSENPFNLDGSPTYGYSRTLVLIDVDDDPATGYAYGGIGSELLIAGTELFAQSSGVFNAGWLETLAVLPGRGHHGMGVRDPQEPPRRCRRWQRQRDAHPRGVPQRRDQRRGAGRGQRGLRSDPALSPAAAGATLPDRR
ncbi:MAG: hypothetical protein IPM29_14110 [Planctomycetes bacterium]|nr:hypothetical protein [Planctomycetota bacterium]